LNLIHQDNNVLKILPIFFHVNFRDPKMYTATWCSYVMVHWRAWWWLLRDKTCRYMHNWQQI